MGSIKTIEKIMELRENEKNKMQQSYNQSVDTFEKQASSLYHLLKEKETAQADYQLQLTQSLKVSNLQLSHLYIQNLSRDIERLQIAVHRAREEMELRQRKLAEAQIEVKKFSKIIDYKIVELKQQAKMEEIKLMDELSVRQFMSYEKR